MMRALFAGVSGLRNHQVRLDVIGNNIANVNTVAFKGSRVTFEEAFAQLLRGASRPPGDPGGINPIQIGLGMNIGSIDQNFTQGNFESTGVNTDLAIQGDAFFVASNGPSLAFTRSGNFQLDADGRMVLPTNGFSIQGVVADTEGNLPTGTALSDIIIPLGQKSPARPTTEIDLTGNLDTREEPMGTILRTEGRVFAIEQTTSNAGAGSDINTLYANGDANAQILGMSPDRTTVTVSDGTTSQTYTYLATDTAVGDSAFNSLNDLIAEINNDFATVTAALNNTTGAITITEAAGVNRNMTLSSSNAVLQRALAAANGTINASSASTDEFSHIAESSDLLTNLRNGQGASLGLSVADVIAIDASIGGTAVTQGTVVVGASSTYDDVLNSVNTTLGLTNTTGSEIVSQTGAMQVTGDGGLVNEITGLNIRVPAGVANFDAIFDSQPGNYLEVQEVSDVVHEVAISVFDSLGNPNILTLRFTKDPTSPNRWLWTADVPPPGLALGGDTGAVTFDDLGRLETFTFDGGALSFQFDPGTGATAPVDIRFNSGTLGDINGLSQFAAPSNAVASGQDGHAMGNLQEFSIDEQGIVTGFFTNGESQVLARIALAAFANPTGLLRQGDNVYEVSGNSGQAVIGFAGTTTQSVITPGAIESSNVDLSEEFTSMIIAQRGFQANARVITTSDEVLTELVNLKR